MIRKLIALTLVFLLLVGTTACANDSAQDNQQQNNESSNLADGDEVNPAPNDTQENAHTGKKISGEITGASVFSEGLAFVNVNGEKDTTYCINSEGYIVFELNVRADNAMGEIRGKFVNGLAFIDGGLCNRTGKITYPEDVGVTAFCDLALEGGYILAERITSNYDSSKKELGVMSTSFEWIIEPSEEIYGETGGIGMLPDNTKCFYDNDWFYFESAQKYMNLKDGQIVQNTDQSFPSEQWNATANTYVDYNGNILLDLSKYETIQLSATSDFVDGKAPVRFFNRETGKYYFSLIDEQGNLLFEPVETGRIGGFAFDGKYILVANEQIDPDSLQCYDSQGNLLGKIELDTIAKNMSYKYDISDGIIILIGGRNFNYICHYLDCNLSLLFQH